MNAFDLSRPNIAAHATGLSRAAYEHALQYSNERQTFGKPLHKHQAIQFMLADMKTGIEASRMLHGSLLQMLTLASRTRNLLLTLSASQRIQPCKFQPMQSKCTEDMDTLRNIRLPDSCVRAKVMQIYEGSSQVQRMIIGREITKNL